MVQTFYPCIWAVVYQRHVCIVTCGVILYRARTLLTATHSPQLQACSCMYTFGQTVGCVFSPAPGRSPHCARDGRRAKIRISLQMMTKLASMCTGCFQLLNHSLPNIALLQPLMAYSIKLHARALSFNSIEHCPSKVPDLSYNVLLLQ